MAGVVGSTDISGTNYSFNGSSVQCLNPVDVLAFATGDVVTEIAVYIQVAPSGDSVFVVGLYEAADFTSGADGASLVWSKEITITNAAPATSWLTFSISNEAISATNGNELAVALSSRVSGASYTGKLGASGDSRSNAAAGATLASTWTETGTTDRQLGLTVTTAAGGGGATYTGSAFSFGLTASAGMSFAAGAYKELFTSAGGNWPIGLTADLGMSFAQGTHAVAPPKLGDPTTIGMSASLGMSFAAGTYAPLVPRIGGVFSFGVAALLTISFAPSFQSTWAGGGLADAIKFKTGNKSVVDGMLAYYLANGATTPSLADAEYEYLIAQGVSARGLPDMWKEYLTGLGYTGGISDMMYKFWSNL